MCSCSLGGVRHTRTPLPYAPTTSSRRTPPTAAPTQPTATSHDTHPHGPPTAPLPCVAPHQQQAHPTCGGLRMPHMGLEGSQHHGCLPPAPCCTASAALQQLLLAPCAHVDADSGVRLNGVAQGGASAVHLQLAHLRVSRHTEFARACVGGGMESCRACMQCPKACTTAKLLGWKAGRHAEAPRAWDGDGMPSMP